MEIRTFRQDTIRQDEAEELARLLTLVDPSRLRSDPPVHAQLAINELRPSTATFLFEHFGLFDGPHMIGFADSFGAVNAENADVCEVGVFIDPSRLDEGLHRLLFDHVAGLERARGRTRFWGYGDLSDSPTRSFWEAELGYSLAYDERISRCQLDQVDPALMQRWIDGASQRASGYHLVRATAPFDEQVIEYFARGLEAMNDAPLDDLVHEPEVFDAARAREVETLHLATRCDYRAIFAIETATGELAGYTAVRIPDAEPALAHQGDTVTLDAHRNKGIGRWLKADMWQWLRHDRPDVASLDTGNAESNRAMLAINEAMGFRDVLHLGVWHNPSDHDSD